MTPTEYRVALVVDPNFGQKLVDLASNIHVWAIDSPSNREVTRQYWAENTGHSIETGITLYTGVAQPVNVDELEGTLQDVELHDGHLSHAPEVTIIDVFGSIPPRVVAAAFATIGFEHVESTDFGYRALRKRTATSACNGARTAEIDRIL